MTCKKSVDGWNSLKSIFWLPKIGNVEKNSILGTWYYFCNCLSLNKYQYYARHNQNLQNRVCTKYSQYSWNSKYVSLLHSIYSWYDSWCYKKKDQSNISDYEQQGIIKHTINLTRTYRRLYTLTAEKNSKDELILTALPIVRRFDELTNLSKQERDKIILNEASQPRTDIRYIQDREDAMEHLKEYTHIDKYWRKSEKLLKKYNDKKDKKIISELNTSLKNFNRELTNLVGRIEKSNHIIKGKCKSCP
ncbi:MAG: hypothetical protein WBF38_01365 [Nitrosotalea sp.]